ncbi:Riboflavin biosynthesis protein ribF [Mycoplasmopsis arginini]|nr:Riboflavin biosynthesis protein ribF [Chlamydia abortus]SGA05732.1 Riboflavin biosynthesis protein ribF [Mycoplasmopsis arginini]SGA19835.1 Riboflavin biosynthesis protein ribF [Mycoplasmopsis arginini]SGA31213.1 Riboflavin biosynthesis protein ribF [Chlamydia abortus]
MVLGSFETLHLGHYELIKIAKDIKISNPQTKLAIMIFNNTYKGALGLDKKAMQTQTRLYTLFNLGFDFVFLANINKENLNVSHEDFCKNLLLNNVKFVICGKDFKFGFRRLGNIEYLSKFFNVTVANERKIQKRKISSTLINELIEEGNIFAINNLLIEKYAFITNFNKFNFAFPNKIKKIKPGIYIANFVIDDIEYHGLIKISNVQNNENDNLAFLLDLEIIPSKYQDIFVELEALIRHINLDHENEIRDNDIELTKK